MEPNEKTPQQPVQRLSFGIDEAAMASGLSRSHLYRLAASGELKTSRVGHRLVIPAHELYRLLGTSGNG